MLNGDYMQVNRLFEIIYVLLGKKIVTAKELAERFEVSQRTIYRDVDVLSLAGIPIYTEKGKGGGISLLPEFVFNKSLLSEAEQNEILSALHGLSIVKTTDTEGVLKKLSTIFNKSTTNWLEVDFSGWSYQDGEKFNDFKNSIIEQRLVEFDYYSTFGEKTKRRIEPIQLYFKSRAWYIKGFCLNRHAVRLFKLSRVKNLIVTNEHFKKRDLLCSNPNSDISEHERQDIRLKLKITQEMTYRVMDEFDEHDVEVQPDGSFIVTVIWPEDDWVYGTILSYGEHIEVLEPVHVRGIIKNKALETVKKYL